MVERVGNVTWLRREELPSIWRELTGEDRVDISPERILELDINHPIVIDYIRRKFQGLSDIDRLSFLYIPKLLTDPISRDFPGAVNNLLHSYDLAIALRCVQHGCECKAMSELVSRIMNWPVRDFFSAISLLSNILRRHGDPYMRYIAVKMMDLMFSDRDDVTLSPEHLVGLFGIGLKDREPAVALAAWEAIEFADRKLAKSVDEEDLSSARSAAVGTSSEFKIAFYVGPDFLGGFAMEIVFNEVSNSEWEDGSISVRQFTPIHSLADYNPVPADRNAIMQQKYEILKGIVAELGVGKKEEVLNRFLSTPSFLHNKKERIAILVFPSGRRYLVQGHHRIAALIKAAADGLIPADWLDNIPVEIAHYDLAIPEPLARRVLTRGVDLTWANLFPGGTDLSGALGAPSASDETPPRGTSGAAMHRDTRAHGRKLGRGVVRSSHRGCGVGRFAATARAFRRGVGVR